MEFTVMETYDEPKAIYGYRYQGKNDSILDKVLYVNWWKLAIKAVPAGMSANLLSMLGNTGSWAALAILSFFGASYGPDRPWIFSIAGALIFFYHTLDCLDGIQARRIGASGPLGEFIDHWFDGMNVFFLPLGVVAAFPAIPTPWAVCVVLLSGLADWVALREVYRTGILRFGLISTEEGISLHMLFLITLPLVGYGFWSRPLPVLGIPPVLVLVILFVAGQCFLIFSTLIRLRCDGLRELSIQIACTAPLAAWVLAGQAVGAPRWALLFGLLCMGFVGTRHVGDLLRVRLLGLRYPRSYPDLIIGALAVLLVLGASASAVHFGTPRPPLWVFIAPVAAVFLSTLGALFLQFFRTLRRVRSCLGIGLFDIPDTRSAAR